MSWSLRIASALRPLNGRLLLLHIIAAFRDEVGNELFGLPDAARPDPDSPAPVRFLPEYDNLFVSHADRSRVISETHLKTLRTTERLVRGYVLVDGFFRGLWQIRRRRGVATLHIEWYGPLSNQDRDAVTDEGARLRFPHPTRRPVRSSSPCEGDSYGRRPRAFLGNCTI